MTPYCLKRFFKRENSLAHVRMAHGLHLRPVAFGGMARLRFGLLKDLLAILGARNVQRDEL